MRDKKITDGKVTYIHGATPRFPDQPSTLTERIDKAKALFDVAALHPRTTLEQLEAGEVHPDLYQPMPAAPSIRSYGDIKIVGTPEDVQEAISLIDQARRENPEGYRKYLQSVGIDTDQELRVTGYLGETVPESRPNEPDELDIWAPDTNQSPDYAELVEWPVIVGVFTILTLTIAAIAGILYFAQFYDFSDFPITLLNTPGSTPK